MSVPLQLVFPANSVIDEEKSFIRLTPGRVSKPGHPGFWSGSG